MSADAVRAAAEALHASWKVGADSFSQDMAGHAAQRDAATAVAAAEPIIRASALREAADKIDRGPDFPMHKSVFSALLREFADDAERGGT